MTHDEAAECGPEFVTHLGMRFVAVRTNFVDVEVGISEGDAMLKSDRINVFQDIIKTYCLDAATEAAVLKEIRDRGLQPSDYVLIPVHPHQASHAIPNLHASSIEKQIVVPLKVSCTARPLMNYRTLVVKNANKKEGLHVKTALTVQLTSAIRGVSSTSARNAPRLSKLLASIVDGNLELQRTDAFGRKLFLPHRILAGIAFKESCNSLAAILREDVENLIACDEVALPVASLFARSPLTKNTVITDLISELGVDPIIWFKALTELVVPPLIILMSRYGIALEPHPQNLIVILRKGWPHRFTVRDFGGIRVLPSRLATHGLSIDLDCRTGLVIDEKDPSAAELQLRSKLFYPLFGHSFAELVSAISSTGNVEETDLWEIVRTVAWQVRRSVGSDETNRDLQALLEEPWRRKCLLKMRLSGVVTDDIYVDAPNPFKQLPRYPTLGNIDLTDIERRMFAYLSQIEPDLCHLWMQELPTSKESIEECLQESLARESVAYDADFIMDLQTDWKKLRIELMDSAANLALSRALVKRRSQFLCGRFPASKTLFSILKEMYGPSDIAVELDSLDATGHPTHPCRKTRLGFSPADSLAYSSESGQPVSLKLVAIRNDHVIQSGEPVKDVLQRHYPFVVDAALKALLRRGFDAGEFQFSVIHPFQFHNIIPQIYEEEIKGGTIVLLPEVTISARPTSSTRTLLTVAPGVLGERLAIKTTLDVQITSIVRTITHEEAMNGPCISKLLTRLLKDESRWACVAERSGIAFVDKSKSRSESTVQRIRDEGISCILRDDIEQPRIDEMIIRCSALITASPISGEPLIVECIKGNDKKLSYSRAADFLDTYANLLLSITLPLLWSHGIVIEAHLQNTLITLKQNKPTKILLQDFGLTVIHRGRLFEAGESIENIPYFEGEMMTDDIEHVYKNFEHSVIFTNLMPVVKALVDNSKVFAKSQAWGIIRQRILKIYDCFVLTSDPTSTAVFYAGEHLTHLLYSPLLSYKAFITMRLLSAFGYKEYHCSHANPLYLPKPLI
ncbi:unnamed protein product [Bemisia tabaci]|uniref:Uncharacterized protein n=1 Tax=Bemisia tabaci TaxID=7038 RepID=A0A9P0C6W8_BEMTA|nr:unnamed protein product [Bemisia tabaci]